MNNSRPLILLLISFGLFYTFVSPQYKEVKSLGVEASEYSSVLDSVANIESIMTDLYGKYQQFPPEEIDRLEKALPNNADVVHLALDLDSMANKYGLSVSSVSVDPVGSTGTSFIEGGEKPPYSKVLVTFNFTSNYQSFQSFLKELEQSLRVTDIRAVSFQVGETSLYEHAMTVETYWIE